MTTKQIQLSRKAVIATRVIIAVLILAAATMIFIFAASITEKRTLINKGTQVIGTVNTQEINIHTSRSGSMTSRTLSYSFTPEGSQQKITQNEFYVSEKEFENHPQGSDIQVTYLHSKPYINQPTIALRHIPILSVMIIYFIGMFIACYLCIKIGKAIRKKYNIKKKQSYWNMPLALGAVAIIVVVGMCFAAIISKLVALLLL